MNDIVRFWNQVDKSEIITSCWIWLGTKNYLGYGQFRYNKKMVRAHRFSYEITKGEIPKGLTIDHLCSIRSCVNPFHLEAITQKENIMRGLGLFALNKRKTHCKNGHELSEDNLDKYALKNNRRQCKKCINLNYDPIKEKERNDNYYSINKQAICKKKREQYHAKKMLMEKYQ